MSIDAATLERLLRALNHRPDYGLAIVHKADLQRVLDALQAEELP